MKQRIIFITIFILITALAAGGYYLYSKKTAKNTESAGEENKDLESAERMSNEEFANRIKEKSKEKIEIKRDLLFGGHLNSASEGNVQLYLKNEVYLDSTLKMLKVLEEAGVDTIQFYFYPELWEKPEVQNYYDMVINKIRSDQKYLYLGYQGGGKDKHIYKSYAEYKETALKTIEETAGKYKPDYYSVVVEPRTMEKRGHIEISDTEWLEYTKEAAEAVRKVSPNTKVVATVTPLELGLMEEFSKMDNIDILGINPYRETLLVDEVVKKIDELAKVKPIYFPEVWISADYDAKYTPSQESKFLNFVFDFTMKHDIYAVTPFYSHKFVTASSKLVDREKALEKGARTENFYTYQEFIKSVRKKFPK